MESFTIRDVKFSGKKLEGREDYPLWEFIARLYFDEYNAWDLMDPDQDVEYPLSVDQKAKLRVMMNKLNALVTDGPRIHLLTCKDARDAFKALRDQYRPRNLATTLAKRNRFFTMKQREDESMNAFIARMTVEHTELTALGHPIDEYDRVNTLLNGVVDRWKPRAESMRQLNEHQGAPMDWATVTGTLVSTALRHAESVEIEAVPVESSAYRFQGQGQKGPNNGGNNQSRNGNKKGKKDLSKIKCYACQEMGHYANKCPKKSKNRSRKDDESDGDGAEPASYVAAAPSSNVSDDVFIDGGCTYHASKNRQFFIGNLRPVSGIYVKSAKSDTSIYAQGVGMVSFKCVSPDGKIGEVNIQEAYWFPDADCNLLSQGRLMESAASFEYDKALNLTFKDSRGKAGLTARYQKGNKMWKVQIIKEDPRMNLAVGGAENWNLWHQRTGHRAMSALKATENLTTGMNLHGKEPKGCFCLGCQLGKGHRDPFPSTGNKAEKPLEKIHADLFGPIVDISKKGNRFGLVITDDMSASKFFYGLSSKDKATEALQSLFSVAKHLGHTIKHIRTDGDTVFKTEKLKKLYADLGIQHTMSVPYTPQQNGAAERAIRTITESANALKQQALNEVSKYGLDKGLWDEACAVAAYVQNRTWHAGLPKTPYELLTGKKPDLAHLRVFGSTASIHIPKPLREKGKFTPHRELVIFTGYPADMKGWRFFRPSTNKFVVAREASFLENERLELAGEEEEDRSDLEVIDVSGMERDRSTRSVRAEDREDKEDSESEEDYSQVIEIPQQPQVVRPQRRIVIHGPREPHPPPQLPHVPQAGNVQAPQEDDREREEPRLTREQRRLQFDRPGALNAPIETGQGRSLRSRASNGEVPRMMVAIGGDSSLKLPATYQDVLKSEEKEAWLTACQSEITSLEKNGTFEVASLPEDRSAIDTKWVFALKLKQDGSVDRFKARVVARGFKQIYGQDFMETFSPVACYPTIRLFFALAAANDWHVQQVDAVTAFLNAPLEEEIYVKPPEGHPAYDEGLVWRLKRALYGLKQAGREWWKMLHQALQDFDIFGTEEDCCLLISTDGVVAMVTIVDDMAIAGPPERIEEVIKFLESRFQMKRLGDIAGKTFVGLEISRDRSKRTITLRQGRYAREVLARFGFQDVNPTKLPMAVGACNTGSREADEEAGSRLLYQSMIGSLMFLMITTRPDLAFSVGFYSRFSADPAVRHIKGLKQIFRYIQGTKDMGLVLGGNSIQLTGYTDAAYGDDTDHRRSTGGYVYTLGKGAISWSSKRQPCVALSTAEAELRAAVECAKEGLWLHYMLKNFGIDTKEIEMLGDNRASIDLAYNPKAHGRTKHVQIRANWLKEGIEDGIINFKHIPGTQQVANPLTKPVAKTELEFFKNEAGLLSALE